MAILRRLAPSYDFFRDSISRYRTHFASAATNERCNGAAVREVLKREKPVKSGRSIRFVRLVGPD
jgi:hypothetical protein